MPRQVWMLPHGSSPTRPATSLGTSPTCSCGNIYVCQEVTIVLTCIYYGSWRARFFPSLTSKGLFSLSSPLLPLPDGLSWPWVFWSVLLFLSWNIWPNGPRPNNTSLTTSVSFLSFPSWRRANYCQHKMGYHLGKFLEICRNESKFWAPAMVVAALCKHRYAELKLTPFL